MTFCFCGFFYAALLAGCGVITLVTLPVKAVGTAVEVTATASKITGKAAVGTAKLMIPDSESPDEKPTEPATK